MSGEINLLALLRNMQPHLYEGEFVFCTVPSLDTIDLLEIIGHFREEEGITLIVPRSYADSQDLPYAFIASWITLKVHSSLEAVGLTAAFSQALAKEGISCNVVAAYYHDHIFVNQSDAARAMDTLKRLSREGSDLFAV
ncbi:MAG TPA: ACT domain-containing protein [Chitinophagaceae bacterium]|nr:ACT domain-containing protein [Chitinophagaceae bacterium]